MIPAGPNGRVYLDWLAKQAVPPRWQRDLPRRVIEEVVFNPRLHPRGRTGKFIDTPNLATDYLDPHLGDAQADKAIQRYVDGWDRPANCKLRGLPLPEGTTADPADVDDVIAGMDEAIQKRGKEVKATVYRGLDLADLPASVRESIERGDGEFDDAGFVSTTGSYGVALSFAEQHLRPVEPAILVIHCPKGTKALPYDKLDEAENILPRGGHFKIVSIGEQSFYGAKVKWVHAEWSPHG